MADLRQATAGGGDQRPLAAHELEQPEEVSPTAEKEFTEKQASPDELVSGRKYVDEVDHDEEEIPSKRSRVEVL